LEKPQLKNFIENANIPKEDKFIEFFFSSIKRQREQKLKEAEKLYQEANTEFLYEKNRFYNERNEKNNQVDSFRKSFENGEKEEYMSLNLERVVARDCFRKLNGQSSGSLYHLSPIRPILELNTEDKRFIETRDIIIEINSVLNLAEMKWDDFEHLIPNLFSLYFKEIGEVKITRKSREGGIDGVIFDTDPIRGGKYLVQAKRYNSIVPPSAVRDLNGAKDHEKAT
jgi:hypothetical protein